ncbi:NAD(P)H-dependent oxidoreductase subunit E [Candidatus Acetothermia bacterium]|nr:NAD(P)H-dependent oxidoreductase subunit E [Candidatus Acetothermia bacterium]MCI2427022.1 NAD(P)H-dependent oxidoreductase subunit E [Candidatus Acetothermia bacterium]MCI2428129.1 NAD(P)H-dependent oxidoreductase subunit E [Candidatus Acetothermia bacterium]
MKTIKVCVGSSCFLRGASEVIDLFQSLIDKHGQGKVKLAGMFCQEKCTKGVTVFVDEEIFSGVGREDVAKIFQKKFLDNKRGEEKEE